MDIKDELMIENTIDLYGLIEGFSDRQRIALVRAAIETADDDHTIERIRKITNDPSYD
jgi:hypothetical protein